MFTVVVVEEAPFYVAECPELGVSSFGHDEKEARENLADAIEVYLKTLEDLGQDRKAATRFSEGGNDGDQA